MLIARSAVVLSDTRQAISRLKQSMLGMNCPVGILITPERTWLLHDTFSDYTEASIATIGELATDEVLERRHVPRTGTELQHVVHVWLEQISTGRPSALPAALAPRKLLGEHVLPAAADGRVVSVAADTNPRQVAAAG